MSQRTFSTSTEHYQAGEIIFRQGYPGTHAYIIQSGEVAIIREMDNGSRQLLAVLKAGEMFGEIAVLDDVTRTATAEAHTDCVLQIMAL